jgi:NAD(P)H-dependent flavin oxidoreductase YrpB (nitropropane dioxygenase family)
MAKKVLKTRLCDMLGIEYPIICAGMGPTLIGETTGAPVGLVVAVSEAGGMGVLGGSRSKQKQTNLMGLTFFCPKSSTWVGDSASMGQRSCP